MNPAKTLANSLAVIASAAVLGALTGCVEYDGSTGYGQTAGTVAYSDSAGDVAYAEIGSDNDFYEPLSPYGRWEVVGAYGRCWVPGRVESGWRPYCEGQWVSTDDGWYFESDEPWGWATYHYGRWAEDPRIGWCWVPGTQWAPAWVSWSEGDGYIGWAPLGPGDRFEHGGFSGRGDSRRFVYVQERRFLDRVRPSTVAGHDAVNFNRTTNITNIRVVNNRVVNEGPRREVVERVSGRTIRPVAAREVRREREAPVLQRRPPSAQRPAGGTPGASPAHEKPVTAPATSPRVPRPAAPAVVSPPPASHRETAPVSRPTPRNERQPRPTGNEPSRVVTPPPSRVPGPSTERVAPPRVPVSPGAAPAHEAQTVKPNAGPKASTGPKTSPAPKSEHPKGDRSERKGGHDEKPDSQQAN